MLTKGPTGECDKKNYQETFAALAAYEDQKDQ